MAGNIPITGLTMLGQTLLNAGTDYAAERRKTEDEQRIRSEHLSDVASQRQYEQQNFDKVRAIQLSDEQRRRLEGIADLKTRGATELRMKLLNEAGSRGLIDPASLGNEALENSAIQQTVQQLKSESSLQQQQPANAQAQLTALAQQKQDAVRRLAAAQDALSTPPKIDMNAVSRRGYEIAKSQQKAPWYSDKVPEPTKEEIASATEEALKEAQTVANQQWYQQKEDARVLIPSITSEINTIRQQEANVTSAFHVVGSPGAAPTASPLVQAPPSGVPRAVVPASNGTAPLAGFLGALDASTPRPTTGAGSNLTMQDTVRARAVTPPELMGQNRQLGTLQLADQYSKLDAVPESTAAKLQAVNQQLQLAQQGVNPLMGVSTMAAARPVAPQAQGEYITRLLLQKSALQNQYQKEQAEKAQGKFSALKTLQPNAPAFSAPQPAASPGSILSDPYGWNDGGL